MQTIGRYLRRMDRLCADMNVVLLVIAIGLATLDFTCFFGKQMLDQIHFARQHSTGQVIDADMTAYTAF